MNKIPTTLYEMRRAEMTSNKKMGNDFELEFCKLVSSKGFWAHRLNENKNGQPADVIICKNNVPVLIDCKVCENNKFLLSRIEENQELAMTKWTTSGNKYALFALKIENDVRLISFHMLMDFKRLGTKQLNKTEIENYGYTIDTWEEIIYDDYSQ